MADPRPALNRDRERWAGRRRHLLPLVVFAAGGIMNVVANRDTFAFTTDVRNISWGQTALTIFGIAMIGGALGWWALCTHKIARINNEILNLR